MNTANELIEKISQSFSFEKDWNVNDGTEFHEFLGGDEVHNEDFNIRLVEDFGGEGMGDDRYLIFQINDTQNCENCNVKFRGFYDSWNGSTWDEEPIFVYARRKVITIYEETNPEKNENFQNLTVGELREAVAYAPAEFIVLVLENSDSEQSDVILISDPLDDPFDEDFECLAIPTIIFTEETENETVA